MIGLFNDCFPSIMDGVSLTTQNYAHWLHKKMGNACIVTPKSPDARDAERYPVYRYSSIPIPMRKPYRLGFPRIDWPFHERISQLSFGLVHAHCPFSSGALAMQVTKEQHVPVVAAFHSRYRADSERVIPPRLLVDYLIRKVIRFYEAADEVWIPQAAAEETLWEYGYKGRVEVVDNGNDFTGVPSLESMRREARRELGLCSGEFILLFVGQHIWEENLGFLLDALALLPGVPFRMYSVGSDYANDELKQKVAGLELSSKVTFAGSIVEREVLKRYYVATGLSPFPPLYDNAPLIVREATALGTPSMLIKDSTASGIISDSVSGFLGFNGTDTYTGRICEILQAPAVIRQVGEEASRTTARSWEDVTEEVHDRYSRLIKRKEDR